MVIDLHAKNQVNIMIDLHAKNQVNIYKRLEKKSGKLFDC